MPTLAEQIDTTGLAIVEKIEEMIATGSVKDLTLASKALEALRGTATMQAILSASQSSLTSLAASLLAAQNTLEDDTTVHGSELSALKISLAADLNFLATTIQDNYLSVANGIGAPRVGDIFMQMYPDPTALPLNVSICDGRYIPLADSTPLVTAWGMGIGGVICPMVVNYNAGVAPAEQIILDGTGLRLPNFNNFFFKATAPASVGAFQAEAIGNHVHAASQQFVASAAGTGTGVNTVGSASFRLEKVTSTNNPTGATENRPKNFGALALVRFR